MVAWGRASATKWLVGLLCASFALGVLCVFVTVSGLTGIAAQGVGLCPKEDEKAYSGLGKWDDGPAYMHLNWFVCEIDDVQWQRQIHRANEPGWKTFGTAHYKAVCGWKSFQEANHTCMAEGAHLVSIGSQEENTFVQKLCGWETCWIGLHERSNTEDWKWADGVPVGRKPKWSAYTNWAAGEPNNNRGIDESVAFMNGWFRLDMPNPKMNAVGTCRPGTAPRTSAAASGEWHDVEKDFRIAHSICEKGTSNFCAEGWIHRVGQDHRPAKCYKKVCALYNFWEATEACAAEGAKLTSIGSDEENHFVRNICGVHTCRIGLSEKPDSEEWAWADGSELGAKYEWTAFQNWAKGEPNNWGGHDENSAVMNRREIVKSARKAYLFAKIMPLAAMWTIVQLSAPLLLLVMTCISSRCNSACLAQAICIITGVSSIGLALELVVWLFTAGKVDDEWPGGSATLLIFLAVAALGQIVICCAATSKAQELQWATTVRWNALGVREVSSAGGDPGTELNPAEQQA